MKPYFIIPDRLMVAAKHYWGDTVDLYRLEMVPMAKDKAHKETRNISMKKKHSQPTKTGKAMSNISTAKLHKPSQKGFNATISGLEGEHRDVMGSRYTKAKRAKRLEGKSV